MSRIKPEDLPKPKQVSKKKSKEMLKQFSSTGTSKYDVYVEAASGLKPGEGLETLELPENVITSIQKKFREKGLTKAKGWYAISRTVGTEKKGNKTLLIGRYEETPKAVAKPAARKTTRKPRKTTARATKASQAKRNTKATPARASKPAAAKKTTTRKRTTAKATKATATKATATKAKATTAKTTRARKSTSNGTAKKTTRTRARKSAPVTA